MADPKLPSTNRRTSDRHFACFPSLVGKPNEGTEDDRLVMIYDLSVTGARLFTRCGEMAVGERMELDIFADEDAKTPPRAVSARVVRVETLEFQGLWTHSIGVRFDTPLTDFEDEIKAIAARQAELLSR